MTGGDFIIKLILQYTPSVILPTICSIFMTLIYGNYLSPSDFGKYSIFSNIIVIFTSSVFYFISSSALRFYSSYETKGKAKELISTYVNINIIITIFICMLGVNIKGKLGLILGMCIGISSFNALFINIFRASEHLRGFNILKVLTPVMTTMILVGIAFGGEMDLNNVIFANYTPMFIITSAIIIKLIIEKRIVFSIDNNLLKESMKYGMPLIMVGLLNTLLSSSDRYMIEYFLGSTEVGKYSFGYKIAEISMMNITMVITLALGPQIIKVFEKKGKEAARKILTQYINIHFIIIMPIVFLMFIFINDIIDIMFVQYRGIGNTTKYIIIGTFFYAISMYTNRAFELTKRTSKLLIILFTSAIVNIILNLSLIPIIGIDGAVISTIISYILYVIMSVVMSKHIFKVEFNLNHIITVLIINIIITTIIIIIPNLSSIVLLDIIIKSILYILIYFIFIFLYKTR